MSKYTEVRPLTGEEILSVVRGKACQLGLLGHYAFDDVVSQACLEMLRYNQRGESVGHVMNRAKFCVLDAYRHITRSRSQYKKRLTRWLPYPELVVAPTTKETDAVKFAYAVVELQKIRLSRKYGDILVNLLNGDPRDVACLKVFKGIKMSTVNTHYYNIRCQIKQKNSPYGVLNAIDESKLSAEIQDALRRIRME